MNVGRIQQATKDRYLAVAAGLAREDATHEPAYAHAVSHIRLTDVAARAEIPRATLYRLWGNQHDFWRDLVLFIMTRDLLPAAEEDDDAPPPIERGDDASLLEHIRVAFNRAQTRLAGDPRLILRATLTGYPREPATARQILTWERSERAELAGRVARILDAAGRSPIAPIDTDDLAALLWMWSDGTILLASTDAAYADVRLHPDDGTAGHDGWSLTAWVARCLVCELTEPAEPDVASTNRPSERPAVRPRSPAKSAALAVGADMFAESIDLDAPTTVRRPTGALGHLTLARLARAAGVSRRQIYNVWRSPQDLCRDLIQDLRAADYEDNFAHLDRATEDALVGPPAASLTLAVTEAMFHARVNAPHRPGVEPPLKQALEAHNGNPMVREENLRAVRSFEERELARIRSMMALSGTRMRPGLATTDLNRLMISASKGSVILCHGDIESIRTGLPFGGGRFSTFAIGHHVVVEHSVIRPSSTPRS